MRQESTAGRWRGSIVLAAAALAVLLIVLRCNGATLPTRRARGIINENVCRIKGLHYHLRQRFPRLLLLEATKLPAQALVQLIRVHRRGPDELLADVLGVDRWLRLVVRVRVHD